MKVAFGLKAHSGWAAMVVVGVNDSDFVVIDRRRIELVDEAWAKQPYHAAEDLEVGAARRLVERGIDSAHRIAVREMDAALRRERERMNEVVVCAVLAGEPMPEWTIEEILAVHFRMHKAEGALFREALVLAARACGRAVQSIPRKTIAEHTSAVSGSPASCLEKKLVGLGKGVGAPWAKDQKEAALAAMIALAPNIE